jgi:hypothetical protein
MTVDEIKSSFNETVNTWQKITREYSEQLFKLQPSADAWSVGQVCEHLIESTKRVFAIIDKCLEGNTNENEQKTEIGEMVIKSNILPDRKVQVPSHKENPPLQPESTLAVNIIFEELRERFMLVTLKIKASKGTGKEKHTVFGYLNAQEWLQSIDMHWRHHLKQQQSIDILLKIF